MCCVMAFVPASDLLFDSPCSRSILSAEDRWTKAAWLEEESSQKLSQAKNKQLDSKIVSTSGVCPGLTNSAILSEYCLLASWARCGMFSGAHVSSSCRVEVATIICHTALLLRQNFGMTLWKKFSVIGVNGDNSSAVRSVKKRKALFSSAGAVWNGSRETVVVLCFGSSNTHAFGGLYSQDRPNR